MLLRKQNAFLNIRFDALQQTNRGNHITLVETWDGIKAIEAHGADEQMKRFCKKIFAISEVSTTSAFARRSTE
jgi:quinol monooxygenase YgiN